MNDDYILHYGVKGMRWGVIKEKVISAPSSKKPAKEPAKKPTKKPESLDSVKEKAIAAVYRLGTTINPKEVKYAIRKTFNKSTATSKALTTLSENYTKITGTLSDNKAVLKAIDKEGILRHKAAKYDNLDQVDIDRFKKYTDSARYSRNVNSYLATGEPKMYAGVSNDLKKSLQKNKIDDQLVYRSCNFKFSTNGLAKKLDTNSEADLAKMITTLNKHFSGKKMNENRVFSTSTSPLFAIDTWRKINPTASGYNTYMLINCKGTPGVYADGTTDKGKALVRTRSNQECILAPNKMQYKSVKWDEKRQMFALQFDAT